MWYKMWYELCPTVVAVLAGMTVLIALITDAHRKEGPPGAAVHAVSAGQASFAPRIGDVVVILFVIFLSYGMHAQQGQSPEGRYESSARRGRRFSLPSPCSCVLGLR